MFTLLSIELDHALPLYISQEKLTAEQKVRYADDIPYRSSDTGVMLQSSVGVYATVTEQRQRRGQGSRNLQYYYRSKVDVSSRISEGTHDKRAVWYASVGKM